MPGQGRQCLGDLRHDRRRALLGVLQHDEEAAGALDQLAEEARDESRRRTPVEGLAGAHLLDAAVAQEHHPVADRQRLLRIVGHEKRRGVGRGQALVHAHQQLAGLHRLAVAPDIQGRGLGAYALREVERVAREAGAHWLRFDAYSRNAGIQTFYRKQGFARLREFQMTLPSLGHPDTFTLYEKKL